MLSLKSFVLTFCFCLSVFSAKGGEIIEGDTGDGYVTQSAVNDGAYNHLYTMPVGTLYFNSVGVVVEPFALPYLAPGQTITAATLSFYLAQASPPASPTYNLQLYGLDRVSPSSSTPVVADWFVGSNDSSNILLNPSFITPSSACNQTYSYSGTNLVNFINSQYANPAFSGMSLSTSRYIFFRINADGNVANNQFNAYSLATARNPNRSEHPLLSLTIAGGIVNTSGILQFSFNLPQNAVTSAGVYDTASGALIRTLWNNIQYEQGLNYGVWDGKDDRGVVLPSGSNYQIKLVYHNVQYVWEGMIGNTSANQTGSHVYRALGKIHDMSFSGTTAYYSVGCNESAATFHCFTAGNPQVPSSINMGYIAPFGSLSDPFSAIYYVASDGVHSYWAKVTGGFKGADTYVFALNNPVAGAAQDADGNIISTLYTFPQGETPTDPDQRYSSCVDLDTTPGQHNPASGIAVQQAGNDLFVSHANLNLVRVFDKIQGNLLGSFPVVQPGRLETTANGDVWVISNSSPPAVSRYRFANGTATLIQTINGVVAPVGLGVSDDDSLLLVADGGSSQQVKAFNNASGAALWTYGSSGGMSVSGPNITTSSFNFNAQEANSNIFDKEAFIAFQPDGTFWIEDGGNCRVLHYAINGTNLTYIEQIAYNDVSYCSTVDLTDANRVFNGFTEYSVDYSLSLGGTNGSWKMTKNWYVGLPNDQVHCYAGFSNGLFNVVTLSNGLTYALLKNMISNNFDLYELPATGPARFTGSTFATNPYIYADGTLRYNVTNGSLSSLVYYSQPLTGFDASHNPVWGSPTILASTSLTSRDPIPWSAFPIRTEITASGTVVDFDANQGDQGYHLGGLPLSGNSWQWHSSPSTTPAYSGWFPQDGKFDVGNGVQYAGDQVMTLGRNIIYGYHGEFWQGGEASQWVNFLDNGLMIGRFGTYGNPGTLDDSVDGFAGNAFSPTLIGAANGKTYLYHNDETNHGGTLRWRIDGWNQISELKGVSMIGTAVSLSSPNSGPLVVITSPTQGATYLNGQNVTFGAQVGGTNVVSVQFMDGSAPLGTVSTPPFVLNYSGLSTGAHVLEALATDSNGLTTTSAPVNFTIANDGSLAPPPSPTALSGSAGGPQSVTLRWSEPSSGTTSSTLGQIMSFQFAKAGNSSALLPADVAGAPPFAVPSFNLIGNTSTGQLTFLNATTSVGTANPNLGLKMAVGADNANSLSSLSGTARNLFSTEINTLNDPTDAISISNIPYASYDVVVYSLPLNLNTGPQTSSLTLSNSLNSSTVQQNFTKAPNDYSVSSVAFGSNAAVTDINTVVFRGLTTPMVKLQGGNLAAFQIVERPYDQGTAASYSIQRSTGTGGDFVTIATVSGTISTFTDTSNLSPSTTYQYAILASNSFGSSGSSNVISVSTPASRVGTNSSFSAWQSEYFTPDQLSNSSFSGPTASPFGSDIPNLLAYALQLNPATAKLSQAPSPSLQNGHLTLSYFIPMALTDISFVVEVSSDLVTWNSGLGYTQIISNVQGVAGDTVTIQDTKAGTTQKLFMRLKIVQN